MTVVLGGSRNLNTLTEEVLLRLQSWIEREEAFIVGDAPGIDTVFQAYLKRIGYQNVRVFTSAPELRNNLGGWPVERVLSNLKSRSSAMHSAKDREMTRMADEGLMMWDGESAGTLANVIDLAAGGKDLYLYVAPAGELLYFESGLGLVDWARGYKAPFDEAEKRLRQYEKRKLKAGQSEATTETLFD